MVGGTIIVMESIKQSVTWIIHILEFMRQMCTFSVAIPNELNKMYHLQSWASVTSMNMLETAVK